MASGGTTAPGGLYNALKRPKPTANRGFTAPGSPAVASAAPQYGPQLASRVNSGAITQAQANQTLAQRRTFQSAYGPLWRQKVFGGVNLPKLRTQVASGSANTGQQLVYNRLLQRRQAMLSRARGMV